MARNITQSNALVSGQFTNFMFIDQPSDNFSSYSQLYGNCTCALSATCVIPSTINQLFSVPGLYVGCYVIEALLQSNLQCFYNNTCIKRIQSYFDEVAGVNFTPLNTSLLNGSYENTTIEELLNELMVEKWNLSSSYKNYYNECQPSECSYSAVAKNSAIYIVTTVIGLIGGLIKILKFVVPYMIQFLWFLGRKCKFRRNTAVSIDDI
ncbi:unnamed protein product [Adineta ricciae]|nr:unnamed protein product [Adineta ricciae]